MEPIPSIKIDENSYTQNHEQSSLEMQTSIAASDALKHLPVDLSPTPSHEFSIYSGPESISELALSHLGPQPRFIGDLHQIQPEIL